MRARRSELTGKKEAGEGDFGLCTSLLRPQVLARARVRGRGLREESTLSLSLSLSVCPAAAAAASGRGKSVQHSTLRWGIQVFFFKRGSPLMRESLASAAAAMCMYTCTAARRTLVMNRRCARGVYSARDANARACSKNSTSRGDAQVTRDESGEERCAAGSDDGSSGIRVYIWRFNEILGAVRVWRCRRAVRLGPKVEIFGRVFWFGL